MDDEERHITTSRLATIIKITTGCNRGPKIVSEFLLTFFRDAKLTMIRGRLAQNMETIESAFESPIESVLG